MRTAPGVCWGALCPDGETLATGEAETLMTLDDLEARMLFGDGDEIDGPVANDDLVLFREIMALAAVLAVLLLAAYEIAVRTPASWWPCQGGSDDAKERAAIADAPKEATNKSLHL
jgi:hypothetical protein